MTHKHTTVVHNETITETPARDSTTPPEWQFSLRSLFAVTTIVSIVLALGTYFAGFVFVVAVVALIQVATLLAADWLIRPANRRALAFVTAGSWIVLGSGVAIIAFLQFYWAYANRSSLQWFFGNCLTVAAVVCFYTAAHRWRKLTAYAHRKW